MSTDPRVLALLGNPRDRAEAERKASGAPAPTKDRPPLCDLVENLDDLGDKWTAQCPACAKVDKDSTGNHLVIWPPDGKFGCVIHPGEEGKEHRREIAKLLGLKPGGKGGRKAKKVRDLTAEKAALAAAHAELWSAITEELAGDLSDLGKSAPIPEKFSAQFRLWCGIWLPGDTVWLGTRFDSTAMFKAHLFRLAEPEEQEQAWEEVVANRLDHTRLQPALEGAESRRRENFGDPRAEVVEHDGSKENPTPRTHQVALLRYVMDEFGWVLKWVVDTGGKGIHGHFDATHIEPMKLKEHYVLLKGLGADPCALAASATRIPGAIRRRTDTHPGGTRQPLVWINPQFAK